VIDVGVVVQGVGQAADLVDQRHVLGERTGAEAGAGTGTHPHVAPVVDAIGLLELPGRDRSGITATQQRRRSLTPVHVS
jgi:hypothetical protein